MNMTIPRMTVITLGVADLRATWRELNA